MADARKLFEELQQVLESNIQELEEFKAYKERLKDISSQNACSIVKLNVGGTLFTTSSKTLAEVPNSLLAAMVGQAEPVQAQPDGSIFIDRSPQYFPYILDFYRKKGAVNLNRLQPDEIDDLLDEATYFGLTDFVKLISEKSESPLPKAELSSTNLTTPTTSAVLPPPPQPSLSSSSSSSSQAATITITTTAATPDILLPPPPSSSAVPPSPLVPPTELLGTESSSPSPSPMTSAIRPTLMRTGATGPNGMVLPPSSSSSSIAAGAAAGVVAGGLMTQNTFCPDGYLPQEPTAPYKTLRADISAPNPPPPEPMLPPTTTTTTPSSSAMPPPPPAYSNAPLPPPPSTTTSSTTAALPQMPPPPPGYYTPTKPSAYPSPPPPMYPSLSSTASVGPSAPPPSSSMYPAPPPPAYGSQPSATAAPPPPAYGAAPSRMMPMAGTNRRGGPPPYGNGMGMGMGMRRGPVEQKAIWKCDTNPNVTIQGNSVQKMPKGMSALVYSPLKTFSRGNHTFTVEIDYSDGKASIGVITKAALDRFKARFSGMNPVQQAREMERYRFIGMDEEEWGIQEGAFFYNSGSRYDTNQPPWRKGTHITYNIRIDADIGMVEFARNDNRWSQTISRTEIVFVVLAAPGVSYSITG